jgi:hypothetical protein
MVNSIGVAADAGECRSIDVTDKTEHKRRCKHEAKSTIKPTSEAWILEDGLHDHLLLKVGEKVNKVAVSFLKVVTQKGGC